MHLREFLKSTAREVDTELKNFFPERISAGWVSSSLGPQEYQVDLKASQKAVFEPIWEFLSRGGKRWRPALLLLACESVGGKKKDAMPYTVIPELVHNGTIMVDDVEDGSALRRGKPSTHILYGIDVAVNAGNAMYYLPLVKLFRKSKLSPEKKAMVYDIYSLEMLKLSFGQAMDIYWHKGNSNVNEKQYLQMCSFKTGSLARLSVGLGALLGGASKKQADALLDFATSIGIAFQIQDDILNIKPETIGWGKEIGDDIKEGKRTLMVIHALSRLPKAKKDKLIRTLDERQNSDSDVREAISFLEQTGSIDYARVFARRLVKKSWQKVDKSLKGSPAKSMLKEFADYLIERKI